MELANTETHSTKNHQGNGATLILVNHTSSTHSPLEDTSVTLADPPPRPRVEARDAALQACVGYLPDVRLMGADYMLFGVYQDWVQQNTANHLDV